MTTAAYVLHTNQTSSAVGGYYLLRPSDGGVFAYDGSGNYATSFAGTAVATLGAVRLLVESPPSCSSAQAALGAVRAQLYQVDQQFDLHEYNGSFYTNNYGNQAEWLYSPVLNQYGEHWYTLISSGGNSVLHAWQGYQDSSIGAVVATFSGASVYDNPNLLINATYLPDPAVTATVPTTGPNAGKLSITLPNSSYIGTFKVTVTVSDGFFSASQTATVTSTDTAPTLSVHQNGSTVTAGSTLSVDHDSFPLSDPVTASGADSQPVTTTASVTSYNPLFSLEQQYRLQGNRPFQRRARRLRLRRRRQQQLPCNVA